jgi:hypothetical protein
MSPSNRGAPSALAVATVALAAAAFTSSTSAAEEDGAAIVVENQSQYELRELRVHATASYLDAPNLLAAPLSIGASMELAGDGAFHLTFIREKYASGPELAFTTARPIDTAGARAVRVLVFDESFRVFAEPSSDDAASGCACVAVGPASSRRGRR